MNEDIKNFLILNDFYVSEISENTLVNRVSKTIVRYKYYDEDVYEISSEVTPDGETGTIYFRNPTIYEIIGYLTYYDLINKDYEK